MASREEQIARHLTGLLSARVPPAVEQEMRQSIMDYFMEDDGDGDGQISDSDVADTDDGDADNEAAPVASSLQLHESVSISLQSTEVQTRSAFDVGAHSFPGDESIYITIIIFITQLQIIWSRVKNEPSAKVNHFSFVRRTSNSGNFCVACWSLLLTDNIQPLI